MSTFEEMERVTNELSLAMNNAMDYEVGWGFGELTNTPTKYKGRGRPRKSDYGIWKHPFDGKLKKVVTY